MSELFDAGLLQKCGVFASTGGRRAQVIACNRLAKIAIGLELFKEDVNIVAVDLYGQALKESSLSLEFSNTTAYFEQLGHWVNDFVKNSGYPKESFLGIGISLQGLVSTDGERIVFAEILHCTGTEKESFQKYMDLPCRLIHDTQAAALAEMWCNPEIEDAVYLALNRNFGGTIIQYKTAPMGREYYDGTIEHMCLDPHGPTCYCGKKGCVETFCSADSLKAKVQQHLPDFFARLHQNDPDAIRQWNDYLKDLAIAIDNIRMIADYDFIIGGHLTQFIDEKDLAPLASYVNERYPFEPSEFRCHFSKTQGKAACIGAALVLIERFLESI